MSYLSFENNIIEASGNLILKSTSGTIDISGINDISFNNSNLLDISSIQVNNDVSCASLFVNTISSNNDTILINKNVTIQTGELTLIKTKDLDISDNIIGLNRGHAIGMGKNTSGMLINYSDASNIFFGYVKGQEAFVIADTSYNHDDRDITIDASTNCKLFVNGDIKNNGCTISKFGNITCGALYSDIIQGVNGDSINIKPYSDPSGNIIGTVNITPTSSLHDFVNVNIKCCYPSYNGSATLNILGGNSHSSSHCVLHFGNEEKNECVNFEMDNCLNTFKIIAKYNSDQEKEILSFDVSSNNNVTFVGEVIANSFNATSDYRTKTNIEELDENISVFNLRPLVYLKNGKKEIGLIAHELQEVFPFMVCGEKDGKEMQSVNYNGLIGVLINDVKRLINENQILELNIDTLKSDYDTLKSDYDKIKSRLDILEEKFNKKFI